MRTALPYTAHTWSKTHMHNCDKKEQQRNNESDQERKRSRGRERAKKKTSQNSNLIWLFLVVHWLKSEKHEKNQNLCFDKSVTWQLLLFPPSQNPESFSILYKTRNLVSYCRNSNNPLLVPGPRILPLPPWEYPSVKQHWVPNKSIIRFKSCVACILTENVISRLEKRNKCMKTQMHTIQIKVFCLWSDPNLLILSSQRLNQVPI